MNLKDLASLLSGVCKLHDIVYDDKTLPIKFGPDCYVFYGTPLTDGCKSSGKCREVAYYALTGGEQIEIMLVSPHSSTP